MNYGMRQRVNCLQQHRGAMVSPAKNWLPRSAPSASAPTPEPAPSQDPSPEPDPTPVDPDPTPTVTYQLFDKSTFTGVVPQPYLGYLNQAADRWATYIKFNQTVYDAIKATTFGWNGIKLQSYTELNNSASGTIASCGPHFYYDLQVGGPGVQFNTKSFRLTINKHFSTIYNPTDWVNILTHELGHALGIGIFWSSSLQPKGSIPPQDSFLLGGSYPTAQSGYNAITEDISLTKVPLETTGGSGTSGAHWDDELRPSTAAGSLGKSYPGFSNELMIGYYSSGMNAKISQLSIGALVDFGYEEVTPGANEGIPTLELSLEAGLASASQDEPSANVEEAEWIKLECQCGQHKMECAGASVIPASAV